MDLPQLTDYLPLPVVLFGTVAVFVGIVWLIVAGRRWGTPGGWALLALAGLWVLFNRPIEGPILMRLGHDKGLTVADLLTIVAGLLAAVRLTLASNSERSTETDLSVDQPV